MSSTLLWSNPNINTAFAGQTVTLSETMRNFDYLKIYYRATYTDMAGAYPATNVYQSMLVPVSDFVNTVSNKSHMVYALGAYPGYGNTTRVFYYSSDTQIYFSGADMIGVGGSPNNSFTQPIAIYGVKYVSSGGSAPTISGMYFIRPDHPTALPCYGYSTLVISSYMSTTTYIKNYTQTVTLGSVYYGGGDVTIDVSNEDCVQLVASNGNTGGSFTLLP